MRVEIRSALEWDAEGIDAIVKGCADETALLISPAGSKGYGEWRLGYTGRAARILDATAVKETGVLAAVRTLAPDRPLVFRGEASLVPRASELGKRLRMEGKIAAVARKVGVVR